MRSLLPFLVLPGLLGLALSPLARAATPSPTSTPLPTSIYLNEFLPNPEVGQDEWVELYNPLDAAVDLSGWQIDDIEGGSSPYTIEAGTDIAAKSYAVFYFSSAKLNNSGDTVRLLNPSGLTYDQIDFKTSTRGWSWARDEDGDWQESDLPTPGSTNQFPAPTPTPTPTTAPSPTLTPAPTLTPTPYSSAIYLNEFLPNPEKGEKEWVELYNPLDAAVDLSGWQIDDIEGGSSPYTIEAGTDIAAKSYAVFYFSSAKLNNSGDTVRLLNPSGLIHDGISFGGSTRGWSWAKSGDGSWVETTNPTPGKINQIIAPSPTPTVTLTPTPVALISDSSADGHESATMNRIIVALNELKSLELKTKVEFEGVITAPPEILGSDVIYVQDDGVGIKVVLADLDYSDLKLGDKVKVEGEFREANSEFYVKDLGETVTKLGSGSAPLPVNIKTSQVIEANEGKLVWVLGQVVKTKGSTFYLDDGSGRVKVYIKGSTQIDKPRMRVGDFAKVVGVVSQYRDSYRLLLRFQEDLAVAKELSELAQGSGQGQVLGISLLPETAVSGPLMSLAVPGGLCEEVLNPSGLERPWEGVLRLFWFLLRAWVL